MNRSVLIGLVVCLCAVALVGVSGPIAAIDTASGSSADPYAATTGGTAVTAVDTQSEFEEISSREFDSTTFEITVHENGTAEWTFRYERILSDGSEQSEFETFAEEFEEEETDFYLRFTQQAQALVDSGAEETGREMEASDFNRSASVEQGLNTNGVVEMSFQWSEFSTTDDNGDIHVGDVFDGGFLITDDQSLVVVAGDELVFSTAQPSAEYTAQSLEEADSVAWSGEQEFLDGQPFVILEQPSAEGDEQSTETEPEDEGSPVLLFAAGLLVVAGMGGIVVWYRFGKGSSDEPADGGGAVGGVERPGQAPAQPAADHEPFSETELLTDEDRVVALIRENGGRMKQVNIVEETGWSKSKVSMLLSEMEDDGTISKLRVGRENIISLEGFEPEATKSPFDE